LSLPEGGLVADTPGFSLLDLPQELTAKYLPNLYPEYVGPAADCRFLGCLHRHEPSCAIRDKLAAGKLDAGRYERYLRLLSEIESNKH
jgi:ribosome biogenesis GTPase